MYLLGSGTKAGKPGEGTKTETSQAENIIKLPEAGKTDLLLRFFDSQFFDEWIALT